MTTYILKCEYGNIRYSNRIYYQKVVINSWNINTMLYPCKVNSLVEMLVYSNLDKYMPEIFYNFMIHDLEPQMIKYNNIKLPFSFLTEKPF